MFTGPILAVLAAILINPGARWVRSWRFLDQVPRAGLVLWQAGTLSALCATLLAAIIMVITTVRNGAHLPLLVVGMIIVGCFALSVASRLVYSLVITLRTTRKNRSRHRLALDLLTHVDHEIDLSSRKTPVHVLADSAPLAYCLPGLGQSRVVLSQGTLDGLSSDELKAVLAHERAHLNARHDLLLDWFGAVHHAFPSFARSDIALAESARLVEMLADDAAVRKVGRTQLARALTEFAQTKNAPIPSSALGMGASVLDRVRRLSKTSPAPVLAPAVYLLALGLVLFPLLLLAFFTATGL